MKRQKRVLRGILVFLVAVTIFFGAYQLFVDNAEAVLFDCGSNGDCVDPGDPCGGDMGCVCTGVSPFYYCWPPQGELPTG